MCVSPFQEGKAWTTQLLSVACLSLAAKMEETYVPPSLDLQVRSRAMQIAYTTVHTTRFSGVRPAGQAPIVSVELPCS
jgi:hypothetical protein